MSDASPPEDRDTQDIGGNCESVEIIEDVELVEAHQPKFRKMTRSGIRGTSSHAKEQTAQSRLDRRSPPPDVYSAPRKFDIATLLAVMTAYALMFAVIRILGTLQLVSQVDPTIVWTGLLVTSVGLSQSLLFKGEEPRKASIICGVGFATVFAIYYSNHFGGLGVPCSWVGGAGVGYLAGSMVGGVFLVADYLRRYIDHLRGYPTTHEPDESSDES